MTPTSRHLSCSARGGRRMWSCLHLCECLCVSAYDNLCSWPCVCIHVFLYVYIYVYMSVTYVCLSVCLLGIHAQPCCPLDLEMWRLCQTAGSGNLLAKRSSEQRWRWRCPLLQCLPCIRGCSDTDGGTCKNLQSPWNWEYWESRINLNTVQ